MTMFWIIVVLLIAAALLFMLPPLLQVSHRKERVERTSVNIAIHKDKLAELEDDLNAGVITQDQYDKARQDLDRGLLDDVKNGDEDKLIPESSTRGSVAAIAIGIALPLLSILLYNQNGGGPGAFSPEDAPLNVSSEGHEGPIEDMISSLTQRLSANPNDLEGWTMLGRSYYFQKKHLEASKAYAKAVELSGEANPDLLADLADTMAVANNRQMVGRPYELVRKALTIQPFHQKSLWLAGTGAYQLQDFTSALGYWEKLLTIFPPGSDEAQQVQNIIADAKVQMTQRGIAVPESSMSAQSSTASGSAMATATGGGSVSGVVKMAPVFASGTSPTDTVFIFARAATGPRMPLAILKKQVKDLPISFTLDDSLAMNPAMKLSNFKDIVVGARVSKSGNAMPQSGDFEGKSPVVSLGTTEIPLLINSVVP